MELKKAYTLLRVGGYSGKGVCEDCDQDCDDQEVANNEEGG
jgi:hypothetical protein